MNKTLYIITGPAGVGKSTISKEISKSLDRSVLIEGDDIYHIVIGSYVSPWIEGNHLDYFWKNIISLIKNSLDANYSVVFNYIVNPENVEFIKKNISEVNIKYVVLMVDEEEIVRRDNLRSEDCRMGERSLILLRKFKEKKINSNNILDTTNLSVEATTDIILKDNRFIV